MPRAFGIASLITLALISVANASDENYVKFGDLDCDVVEKDASFFEKTLKLKCVFSSNSGKKLGYYHGEIDIEGLTIGSITSQKINWYVATIGEPDNVKLDGTYVGGGAQIAIGEGVGADYLTGGFNKKVALQPYATEENKGFGLSLSGLELTLKEYKK
jgi:hypothetical protein